jgi:hypothetical protein
MGKKKIKFFTVGLTALLIVILVGATTAIAKADTEEITPSAESPTQAVETAAAVDIQSETPESMVDSTEIPTEIVDCTTGASIECVSTETEAPVGAETITATDSPTDIETETPIATEAPTLMDSPTPEIGTSSPTPTEMIDSKPPTIHFATDDVSGGQIKIRISISDESGVDGPSLSGQATNGNGSVQTCSFSENDGQFTCLLTLSNGNYRVVVSANDLVGNKASVDLPDFTVQINNTD